MRDIEDYTKKYVNKPFEDTMVRIRKKVVIEQCMKYPHANIVEIGCGMSPLFVDFENFDRLIIIEPSAMFATNAQQLAEEKSVTKKIKIVNEFVENIEKSVLEDFGNIDFIIVSSLLHEVDEPQKLLEGVGKLCSRKTIVHINVPNAKSLHRMIAVAGGMIADEHDRSKEQIKLQISRTYDMALLHEEMAHAGFHIVDEGSYFMKPFTHKQMQQCIDAGIIDECVLQGLENVIQFFPDLGAGIYVNVKGAGI